MNIVLVETRTEFAPEKWARKLGVPESMIHFSPSSEHPLSSYLELAQAQQPDVTVVPRFYWDHEYGTSFAPEPVQKRGDATVFVAPGRRDPNDPYSPDTFFKQFEEMFELCVKVAPTGDVWIPLTLLHWGDSKIESSAIKGFSRAIRRYLTGE